MDRYNWLTGCLLSLLSYAAYAQQPELRTRPEANLPEPSFLPGPAGPGRQPAPVLLGLKVGGSLSTKVGDKVVIGSNPPVTWLPGALAGIYHVRPLSWTRPTSAISFALQPELLASLQGYRLSRPASQHHYEVDAHLFYLSLPVCVTANYRRFYLAAGVQASYLLATHTRYEYLDPTNTAVLVNTDTSLRNYQRWEGAGVAGVGYRSARGWQLDLRYTQAWTNLFEANSLALYATATGQYNAVGQLSLSYPLFRGRRVGAEAE